MQQKLQTILFFTFLICAQISITNSLKIKSKFMSKAKQDNTTVFAPAAPAPDAPAPDAPASTDAPAAQHHQQKRRINKSNQINNIANGETTNEDHRTQFHIHHVVPQNLTDINDKLRAKFNNAHKRLAEIDDLRKESLEQRIFHRIKKPDGLTGVAIIDMKRGTMPEKSKNFQVESIQDFVKAFNQANSSKTRRVTVNGIQFKLLRISRDFYYAAVVGKGGIGVYVKMDYLLVMTHNINMRMGEFSLIFGEVINGLRAHKTSEKYEFFKDNFENKRNLLKSRLRDDYTSYKQNRVVNEDVEQATEIPSPEPEAVPVPVVPSPEPEPEAVPAPAEPEVEPAPEVVPAPAVPAPEPEAADDDDEPMGVF